SCRRSSSATLVGRRRLCCPNSRRCWLAVRTSSSASIPSSKNSKKPSPKFADSFLDEVVLNEQTRTGLLVQHYGLTVCSILSNAYRGTSASVGTATRPTLGLAPRSPHRGSSGQVPRDCASPTPAA